MILQFIVSWILVYIKLFSCSILGHKKEPTSESPYLLGFLCWFYYDTSTLHNYCIDPALLHIIDHPHKLRYLKSILSGFPTKKQRIHNPAVI